MQTHESKQDNLSQEKQNGSSGPVAGPGGQSQAIPPPPFNLNSGNSLQMQSGGAANSPQPGQGLGEISVEDVSQGGLNDCYLMAALIALASDAAGQNDIRNAVQPLGNDRYRVRLFRRNPSGEGFAPAIYNIQHSRQGSGAIRSAPWVRVIEQAYALLYEGEDVMGGAAGGTRIGGAARAMEHLTGRSASRLRSGNGADPNELFNQIRTALESGRHVTAGTPRSYHHDIRLPGVYGGHNYAVLGLNGSADSGMITIRNPWGERMNDIDADQASRMGIGNDATFEIPFSDFARVFVQVAIDGATSSF